MEILMTVWICLGVLLVIGNIVLWRKISSQNLEIWELAQKIKFYDDRDDTYMRFAARVSEVDGQIANLYELVTLLLSYYNLKVRDKAKIVEIYREEG